MKIVQKLMTTLVVTACMLLFGCEDNNVAKRDDNATAREFLKEVNAQPVALNGVKLGDSWRVVRYQYRYSDGGIEKEDDVDYLQMGADCSDYKEYWILGTTDVMQAYKGHCYEKDWNGYYEKFHQTIDTENNTITIDYVLDGGAKQFSESWTISSLTDSELILNRRDEQEGSFYQYTFRREDF